MRLSTSSALMTWLTGSCVVGPGSTSAREQSPSSEAVAGRLAERQVSVERHVLLARGRLDGGDDLPGDAELGEAAEAGQAVVAVVADRLVEAEHALLDEVFGVAAGEEVRTGLEAHELVVADHERVERGLVAAPIRLDEGEVRTLGEDLRVVRRSRPAAVVGRASHTQSPTSARLPLHIPVKATPPERLLRLVAQLLETPKVSGSTLSSSREGILVESGAESRACPLSVVAGELRAPAPGASCG